MRIAIIPKDYSAKSWSSVGLSMVTVDEIICKELGVEPDPKYYYNSWFDNFFWFVWKFCKHMSEDGYAVEFTTKEQALEHILKCETECGNANAAEHIEKYIEPIVNIIYDKGYKIVSLNIA